MELLHPFNGLALFGTLFAIILAICFVIGLLINAFDKYGDGDAIIGGLVFGAIIGLFASLVWTGSSYDTYTADATSSFENTYQVSIVEGSIPKSPNDRSSLLMYTQKGGPLACLVSTDDEKYTVVCDGNEIRPVNTK